MKKLRLCIGSKDGKTVAKTHMGDTCSFYVYDLSEDSTYEFVEKRDNTARDMEHAKSDKMKAIIELVKDTQVFVAGQKSPNFVNIAKKTKYQPVIVSADEIEEVMKMIGESFDEIFALVAKRSEGESFNTIPQLHPAP